MSKTKVADPLVGVVMPNGQLDYPHLLEGSLADILRNAPYKDQDAIICNAFEALKHRINETPGTPAQSVVEVEAEPKNLNKWCESHNLDLKKTLSHIKRLGYEIQSLPGAEPKTKVHFMRPHDWTYYSTNFTQKPTDHES